MQEIRVTLQSDVEWHLRDLDAKLAVFKDAEQAYIVAACDGNSNVSQEFYAKHAADLAYDAACQWFYSRDITITCVDGCHYAAQG